MIIIKRGQMKNEIKLVFGGHTSNQWNTIVSDFNQDFDKFKARWRGQGVKMELKTRNRDSILKRMRSTRQTHWDIR